MHSISVYLQLSYHVYYNKYYIFLCTQCWALVKLVCCSRTAIKCRCQKNTKFELTIFVVVNKIHWLYCKAHTCISLLLWTLMETIFILATIIEFLDNKINSTMNEIPEIHKMLTEMRFCRFEMTHDISLLILFFLKLIWVNMIWQQTMWLA